MATELNVRSMRSRLNWSSNAPNPSLQRTAKSFAFVVRSAITFLSVCFPNGASPAKGRKQTISSFRLHAPETILRRMLRSARKMAKIEMGAGLESYLPKGSRMSNPRPMGVGTLLRYRSTFVIQAAGLASHFNKWA